MNLKHLFVLLLLPFLCQAQQTMELKGKSYPATEKWDFICENYALTGTATIQIAKADKGGLLEISTATTDPSFYIGGVAYVYLADQTVMVCTDKNLRENKDGKMTAWYQFSAVEMQKLKTTAIESIRFNIRGNARKFSSQIGNFTAVNKKSYFTTNENKPSHFLTDNQINALYQ